MYQYECLALEIRVMRFLAIAKKDNYRERGEAILERLSSTIDKCINLRITDWIPE